MAHCLAGQYDIAMIDIPMDLNEITAARIAAEQAGEDAGMLHMRDLELAHIGLPPVIDGARRSRLLHTDPIATTWEAWSTSGWRGSARVTSAQCFVQRSPTNHAAKRGSRTRVLRERREATMDMATVGRFVGGARDLSEPRNGAGL